ncbi:MAG TPA: hypothetical protein V6D33_11890 [Cyanophyceae cyanobacterium]
MDLNPMANQFQGGYITGMNNQEVLNLANANGNQMNLNPQQQLDLMQKYGNANAKFQNDMMLNNAAIAAGITNQGANLATGRQMAVNAQANAAQNVANQLNQLSNARTANANMIQGALQAGTGMIRG